MIELAAGPELDRAVANAMGVTRIASFEVFVEPPYSTEFGAWTQEMLDWLQSHRGTSGNPAWTRSEECSLSRSGGDWRADMQIVHELFFAYGATLPLALARLVVTVAERVKR